MTLQKPLLTAFPPEATEQDYGAAAAELDRLLGELPGALAVYEFGSVTALGISDIDRLAVVEDVRAVPAVWPRLTERTRLLAMHTPVLVDAATFSRHRWIAELGDLKLACGAPLPIEERPVPEYSEPLLAAEAFVVTGLKLAKVAVTGRVKVRPLLCELQNVRLDLHLARLARSEAPRTWALADSVEHLRASWWHLDRAQQRSRVLRALRDAPDAIGEALECVGSRVEGAETPQQLRLGGEWRNVTLVPGHPTNGVAPAFATFIGRSRRLGEARWRSLPRRFRLPAAVIALLTRPARSEYEEFRVARRELVRAYADSSASFRGYSSLGLARVFLRT
jgi:hypothetical protein